VSLNPVTNPEIFMGTGFGQLLVVSLMKDPNCSFTAIELMGYPQ
jgi:hypothetical protein